MSGKNKMFAQKEQKSTRCPKCETVFVSEQKICPKCFSGSPQTAEKKKIPLFYYAIFIIFGIYLLWRLFE
jgi:hypothetical protein